MDAQALTRAIPHRPPFLLLDAVTRRSAEAIEATWTPRKEDPLFSQVFSGHYPENPITPGALLCEAVFQAGAVLLSGRLGAADAPPAGVPVLTRIRDARFKRIVRPGETVRIACSVEEEIGRAYYLNGTAKVDGAPAVRVSFTCALLPTEETA